VQQTRVDGNLDSCKVIRQTDSVLPEVINVHVEGMSGHERFSEIGEAPVGAPALAHAVFRATGSWMRSMPFSKISL
jgi:CO/xanthine dehydrogenase Mo-binding subunit